MFRTFYFSLACAALASSLITFTGQAMPFSSGDSQLTAPDLMVVAVACAAGYTWHPRLHRCVKPTCGAGSTWHPRLHRCVTL
jgi:hypothetical protein